MPQHKARWVGGPIPKHLEETIRKYDNNPSARPDGPLPTSGGAAVIPDVLLTDNRLPQHAVRVYGALQAFAHSPETDGPAWFSVHDRVIAIYTGVPIDAVTQARKRLEEYGYIRLKVGSTTPKDWHKGYRGHWHGRNVPPTYEIENISG